MPNNKRIGRSIEELLNDPSLNKELDAFHKKDRSNAIEMPIEKIVISRDSYNEARIEELTKLIKEHGLVNPLVVRLVEGKYHIVSGNNRFQAMLRLNYKKVPVIIDSRTNELINETALIGMIQADKLSPIEEAKAYVEIQTKNDLTQNEVSLKLGKSRSYIANMVRLLTLPNEIQMALEEGKISIGHARTLVGLNEDESVKLLEKIVQEKINVRDLEKITNEIKTKKEKENKIKKRTEISYRILKDSVKIKYSSEQELKQIIKAIESLNKSK